MMAYGQLYQAQRLTLLYPHHAGLTDGEGVHERHQISGYETVLETATVDIARGPGMLDRLGELLFPHTAPDTHPTALLDAE
jgi:5-methylcytosine-specific restriction enzyme subunit McrC